MRVTENVELAGVKRLKNLVGNDCRCHFAGTHGLATLRFRHQLRQRWRRVILHVGRPIALRISNSSSHEIRAQHRSGHLVGHKFQILVQGFRKRHHGMLGHVVDAHRGRAQHARHRCGVDDTTAIVGFIFGPLKHHRRERFNAVNNTHQINADDPVPVFQRVLPDQATRAHTCVIEHPMRCAEASQCCRSERVDLLVFRHVDALRQHLHAGGSNFGSRSIKRHLLDISHHDVVATRCAEARKFEPEA